MVVIVSDIVENKDGDYEFTLWTGEEKLEVVTSQSGLKKWQAVEYQQNSDDTYRIDVADNAGIANGFDLYSIIDKTGDVVRMASGRKTAANYNITEDTQIIYVDVSADDVEDICVNGGTIQKAGNPSGDGETYYRNASFVLEDGTSNLELLIVTTNAEGAYGPAAIQK